jgi:hypothetical protein
VHRRPACAPLASAALARSPRSPGRCGPRPVWGPRPARVPRPIRPAPAWARARTHPGPPLCATWRPYRLLGAETIRTKEHYTLYQLQVLDERNQFAGAPPTACTTAPETPPPPLSPLAPLSPASLVSPVRLAGAAGEPLYRRFSQFVQLVAALCAHRPTARAHPSLDAEAVGALHEWRKRLLAEKRRVGALALKPEVVHARSALLQQLLDAVCQPPYCALLEVRAFFGLSSSAAAGSTAPVAPTPSEMEGGGGGETTRPAAQYSANCPRCGRSLRVTAPPGATEAALFRCPAPGCEAVFKVAMQQ